MTDSAFDELYKRSDSGKKIVEIFLAEVSPSPEQTIHAVLLIIYRLRNNLMHGTKMGYGLADQYDNFHHANAVVMAALEAT